jgi:hypothetical protein
MITVRVFPARTKATPTDDLAFVGLPPLWAPECITTVLVSCTFTWHKAESARLAAAWQFRYPHATVKVGGPAWGDPGGQFEPGMFLGPGYTITSRGCPNRCPKCMVPGREGPIRTYAIRPGHNILDNNLLACPPDHIAAVFDMLRRQKKHPEFTGGLEAARITPAIARDLVDLNPKSIFLAYDRPAEAPAVSRAVDYLKAKSNWTRGTFRTKVSCYTLVGYEGDTIPEAESRLQFVQGLGARVYPMFWRDENFSAVPPEWSDLVGRVMTMGGKR